MKRSKPRTPSLCVCAAVLYGFLSGCAPSAEEAVQEPKWPFERIDLWKQPPSLGSVSGEPALRAEATYGIAMESGKVLETAGIMQGVQQRAGTRLVRRIDLGTDSSLEFFPLPHDGVWCQCTLVVSVAEASAVGDGARAQVVARVEMPAPSRFGPAAQQVALNAWDETVVDLVFEVESTIDSTSQDALWGSPSVVTRRDPVALAIERTDERKNVLLIVVDTLRADALGTWGRQPSVTPTLDSLASESQVWLDAYSSLNSTNPSFASLFTGLFAKNHGIYDHRTNLGEERVTLAERFQDAGYRTMTVMSARHVGLAHLDQGFEFAHKTKSVFTAQLAVDQAIRWIDFFGAQPFFAVVHLFDAHMPHTPPMPYAEGLVPARRYCLGPVEEWTPVHQRGIPELDTNELGGGAAPLYLSEVAYLDRQIDRLLGELEGRGLLESTIIAFTADHGENLGDHGIKYDHAGLFDSTTHVPLMIRWPGEPRRRGEISGLVQNMSLYPTLLEATGQPVPTDIDAVSLLQVDGEPAPGRRVVFSEHANQEGESIRSTTHRYAMYREPSRFAGSFLYQVDLSSGSPAKSNAATAEETVNRLALDPETAQRLSKALETWMSLRPYAGEVRPADLDAESLEQLKALGYLN